MSKITIRPMEPEDWDAVSRIYLEGIATEHATFQTTCPPYAAWDASHTKDCRLVLLVNDVIAGWTALHRVDPRWCYRGVAEVSIYVGEQFRGHGLGCHLLAELCRQAEEAGYWTLQSTVLQDNAASRALHTWCAGQCCQPCPAHQVWLPSGRPPRAHCAGLSWPLAGHLPHGASCRCG